MANDVIQQSSQITEHNQEHADDAEIFIPINWIEETRRLKDLRPFEHNPRTITGAQYDKLKESLIEDGYHSRIKATQDGRIIGGHQRIRALCELAPILGFANGLIPILVPDRPLTDRQFAQIMIRDNHNNGLWNMDMLANMFDLDDLHGFGLHETNHIREDDGKKGAQMVCCPQCRNVFEVKGNRHVE